MLVCPFGLLRLCPSPRHLHAPNSLGGDEDYAVLCPTDSNSDVKGWCDWGMGTDGHLCICQADADADTSLVATIISNVQDCDGATTLGNTLLGHPRVDSLAQIPLALQRHESTREAPRRRNIVPGVQWHSVLL